jgi:hypothetical protein
MSVKTKRLRPRRRTERQLAKVGVEIINPHHLLLACKECSYAWQPMIQPGGKLPRGYWQCPQGCNC